MLCTDIAALITAPTTKRARSRSVSPTNDTAAAAAASTAAVVVDCQLPVEVMPFIDAAVLEKTGFRLARLTQCDCTHLGTSHLCTLHSCTLHASSALHNLQLLQCLMHTTAASSLRYLTRACYYASGVAHILSKQTCKKRFVSTVPYCSRVCSAYITLISFTIAVCCKLLVYYCYIGDAGQLLVISMCSQARIWLIIEGIYAERTLLSIMKASNGSTDNNNNTSNCSSSSSSKATKRTNSSSSSSSKRSSSRTNSTGTTITAAKKASSSSSSGSTSKGVKPMEWFLSVNGSTSADFSGPEDSALTSTLQEYLDRLRNPRTQVRLICRS
jgi:hypothetical protein